MRRLTDSWRLVCAIPSSEQARRQARRTIVNNFSAQDMGLVGNEQERNHGRVSPFKDPANVSFVTSMNGSSSTNVSAGGHTRSSDSSADLAEANGMANTSNGAQENHVGYGPNAAVRNAVSPLLGRETEGEPHSTVSCHKAEAGNHRIVTPFQKHGTPVPNNDKCRYDDYNVQKACIHANLWRQEIQKHFGEATSIEGYADSELRESSVMGPGKGMLDDWESFDPLEGHYYDEGPDKEEAMMLDEFDKRRERNRVQIASFVKQHIYGRRRPVDGWKYILNNFGKEGRGSRGSALSGEGQTTGSELENIAKKKEGGGLRRRKD